MKYFINYHKYILDIFCAGDKFENIITQQVNLAEYGISFTESNNVMLLEYDILSDIIAKKEKDKIEFEKAKFEAYAKILQNNK